MKVRRIHSELRETVATYDARSPLNRPGVLAALFRSTGMGDSPTEQFWIIALDARYRPIGILRASEGTATSTLVHPREVFGPAIRLGAVSVAVAHNHPSGDATPSEEDIELTQRLIDAGKLLGVPLLEHVVLGEGEAYYSIRSNSRRLSF